jgi:signal transduction histidine kinase
LLGEPLDAATTRRFLEIARAEALRLGHLVEGMFALSLLDLQETLPRGEVGACDVTQALRAAIDATAHAARLREATVTLREAPDSGEPILAAGSFERVVQTAVNLIDNALKHGAQGGRVEASARRGEGRFAEMLIEDDGPGVPLAERDAIFTLGGRGAGAAIAGSGIGLTTARLIVERMGGEITAGDSALGGALFRVRLPLAAEREGVTV